MKKCFTLIALIGFLTISDGDLYASSFVGHLRQSLSDRAKTFVADIQKDSYISEERAAQRILDSETQKLQDIDRRITGLRVIHQKQLDNLLLLFLAKQERLEQSKSDYEKARQKIENEYNETKNKLLTKQREELRLLQRERDKHVQIRDAALRKAEKARRGQNLANDKLTKIRTSKLEREKQSSQRKADQERIMAIRNIYELTKLKLEKANEVFRGAVMQKLPNLTNWAYDNNISPELYEHYVGDLISSPKLFVVPQTDVTETNGDNDYVMVDVAPREQNESQKLLDLFISASDLQPIGAIGPRIPRRIAE